MSAGMKRAVAYAALFVMALMSVVRGEDPSAYVTGLILVIAL